MLFLDFNRIPGISEPPISRPHPTYGDFLKWWYPTTMGVFLLKMIILGCFGGTTTLRKPPCLPRSLVPKYLGISPSSMYPSCHRRWRPKAWIACEKCFSVSKEAWRLQRQGRWTCPTLFSRQINYHQGMEQSVPLKQLKKKTKDTSSKGQHKLANSMTSTPPLSMTGFNPVGSPISAWFLHSCSNALSRCEGDHLPGCFPDNTARAANAAFHPAGNSWEACYDRVCNMPFLPNKNSCQS